MSYFVSILCGVGNVFLSGCSQVLSLLNLGSRRISELYKNPVQKGESCYR